MGAEWNISVCGLNCAACYFLKAWQGDNAKQQEIVDWFKRDYGKDITPEQTMCIGCRAPKKTHWSPNYVLKNCAEEKQLTHCYECPEFICTKLETFTNDGHESHRKAVDNLKQIKESGLETWINEQG